MVYRREAYISRYNVFRRKLLLPPIEQWEDLTSDEEAVKVLREVYGDDVEKLDLLGGLMAEKKIKGFAISETAFNIFIDPNGIKVLIIRPIIVWAGIM
ncbi:Prostaglandin G/H synthase 2 [Carex littledalei]|uniref:Prostaglandin G/H synthase 2 n=1 Tax=Carex littledalei TaxID=544730 RepID=A0A833V9S6_9POAL|nr:Prostaglandin G/H synthase 2 [Carex littledalei]